MSPSLSGGTPIETWQIFAAAACLFSITLLALILARRFRYRYLLVGWLWYLGTLVPVVGLVQSNVEYLNDRYAYGPYVGLYIAIIWAVADLARRGTSAAAAGFVNFMGYIGAALAGDVMTGYRYEHYGWEVAIYAWAACAFIAAIAAGLLWNCRPDNGS